MSASRHCAQLSRIRDHLEKQLLLQEARHCFDEYDSDGGTERDLRARILEIGKEIQSVCGRYEYAETGSRFSERKPGWIPRAISSFVMLKAWSTRRDHERKNRVETRAHFPVRDREDHLDSAQSCDRRYWGANPGPWY